MNISYSWLNDYLGIDLDAETVAKRLTSIGLEVEDTHEWVSHPGGLEGLVVGHVLSAEPHPNADKLRCTTVDVGAEVVLPIVCGAPNVAAGQKVIVALVGTTLYPSAGDSFQIKKAKIRGEESRGMICAEDEIGLGEGHDGIMVLEDSWKPGTPAAKVFGVSRDTILEIGLTANRADANSHLGTARDLAGAMTAIEEGTYAVKYPDLPSLDSLRGSEDRSIPVEVLNHEGCTRYSGISISGIKVGPSPNWLKRKLESIGVKSINNVVDITNFVLHEYGQPLHAFDLDKLQGGIKVGTMPTGSKFKTLDEIERELRDTDLMIMDDKGGLCIAGVYGGIDSGVTDETTAIFLESARFDPTWIRRTHTRHNLRTDAASHFEKGTDPNMTVDALTRAASLIAELTEGQVASELVDIYPEVASPWKVRLRYQRLNLLVGQEIPKKDARDILVALGLQVEKEDEEGLDLLVPTYKNDVLREADVIEEVLRVYGMDRIDFPPYLRSNIVHDNQDAEESRRYAISEYLAGGGWREIYSASITRSKYIHNWLADSVSHLVELENSLNAELDVLRPSMLFGGLESMQWNSNRQQDNLRFFEFGRVFWKQKDGEAPFGEAERLALFITGREQSENWDAQNRSVSYFTLKATVAQVLERIGVQPDSSTPSEHSLLAYGEDLSLNNKRVVSMGMVNPKLSRDFDLRNEVFYAEFDWTQLSKRARRRKTSHQPYSAFPAVRRDLALVLDNTTAYHEVEAIARKQGGSQLREVVLFDSYEGANLGEGKKSYGIGLFFQDDRKTLTDKQVDKVVAKLISAYERELNASIRR